MYVRPLECVRPLKCVYTFSFWASPTLFDWGIFSGKIYGISVRPLECVRPLLNSECMSNILFHAHYKPFNW